MLLLVSKKKGNYGIFQLKILPYSVKNEVGVVGVDTNTLKFNIDQSGVIKPC